MKILIVDDEEDVRAIAAFSLSRVGKMDVIEAASGDEALVLAAAEAPDLILLDLMMPAKDGVATFRDLASNAATAKIPVIFLTASVAPSEMQRLVTLGALGVITKPFNPMKLAEEVQAVIDGAHR